MVHAQCSFVPTFKCICYRVGTAGGCRRGGVLLCDLCRVRAVQVGRDEHVCELRREVCAFARAHRPRGSEDGQGGAGGVI